MLFYLFLIRYLTFSHSPVQNLGKLFCTQFFSQWLEYCKMINYQELLDIFVAYVNPYKKPLKYAWTFLPIQYILKFSNRIRLNGNLKSVGIMETFLQYVKLKTSLDIVAGLPLWFFSQYTLPFKLYVVTFSNRHYYFPGPFFSQEHVHTFFLKKYGAAIKKRLQDDPTISETIFNELVGFLQLENISYLQDILDHVYNMGLENRAFVHYRWLLKN